MNGFTGTFDEGGDPEPAPTAPKGYKPLGVQQRKDWNNFLDYLEKEGIGGKEELDKRDQSLGLNYLKKYKKSNPESTVSADTIPMVQYEQYLLRKGDAFPGLNPEELSYIRKALPAQYLSRPVSNVDSWLGSVTSRLYYPTATRASNKGDKFDFGVDFESYARSANDTNLQEKYRVK